jgi:O-antigen ligase
LHGVVAVTVVLVFQLALALPDVLGVGRTAGEPGSSDPPATSLPRVLGDRLGSLPELLDNPTSDASFTERLAQYEAAWRLFLSSPIVGVGAGHSIDWVDVSGYPRSGFTADTPLVMPAKFGVLGVLVFLGFAGAYSATVWTALRRDRRSGVTLTLLGFGALVIVGLPLGFLIEDKGAGLAIILLLALAFSERPPAHGTSSNESVQRLS